LARLAETRKHYPKLKSALIGFERINARDIPQAVNGSLHQFSAEDWLR